MKESAAPDTDSGSAGAPATPAVSEDGLMSRLDVIESQPLAQRAAGFEQVHDELLSELQRGDRGEG